LIFVEDPDALEALPDLKAVVIARGVGVELVDED
jgi:hypothetical protein